MLNAIALSMLTSPLFGAPTPSTGMTVERRAVAELGSVNLVVGLLAEKTDFEEVLPELDSRRPCLQEETGCSVSFSGVPTNGTVLFFIPSSILGL